MNLEIVNPLECSQWNRWIAEIPGADIFHTVEWARVLKETYGYQPLYFISKTDQGSLDSMTPIMEVNSLFTRRRGVSLPFSDYCRSFAGDDQSLQEIVNSIIEYGRRAGWKYVEMRIPGESLEGACVFCKYYRHAVELQQDSEQVYSKFKRTVKQNINKAIDAGIQIRMSHAIEDVNDFYRLNCLTRKKHGLPPQPWRFFKNVHQHILANDMGLVVLAQKGSKAIAGGMFFHFGSKAVYKYNASDSRFQHLRANDLIAWKAMEWYSQKGVRELCFGRTDANGEGLRRFKKGFNAKESVIKYYRYKFSQERFVEYTGNGSSGSVIARRMPIAVLRLAGALLYKHIG